MGVLNVKDRLTEYSNRFKMTDVETGQSKTYDLEQVTGEIREVGTPINKKIFDNIDNVLSYQVPQVIKEISGEVQLSELSTIKGQSSEIENQMAKTEYVGTCVGNKHGVSPTVTYNLSYVSVSGDTAVWTSAQLNSLFFDRTTYDSNARVTLKAGNSITYDFKEIRNNIEVHLYLKAYSYAKVKLEYSEDNISWNTKYTPSTNVDNEISLSITKARYVRIISETDTYYAIYYFYCDISENEKTYANNFIVNNSNNFIDGQRILIQTPNETNIITSNTLNDIEIKEVLQPNQKYELIYKNDSFEAEKLDKTLLDITVTEAVAQIDVPGIIDKLKDLKIYCCIVTNNDSTDTNMKLFNRVIISRKYSNAPSICFFVIDKNSKASRSIFNQGASYAESSYQTNIDFSNNIITNTATIPIGTRIIIKEVC